MTTRQFQESSALRIFLSYFKPHRKLFFLDMCCALMIAVIDLAFPYVSRWCMYQLLPESAYRTFFAVMAVVFCALRDRTNRLSPSFVVSLLQSRFFLCRLQGSNL